MQFQVPVTVQFCLKQTIYVGLAHVYHSCHLCCSVLPLCEQRWLFPNHQREEKKAQSVLVFRPHHCSPLSPGQGGQLHRILESVAKENKFTWTWFDLLGNRFWSIDYIYIIQIIMGESLPSSCESKHLVIKSRVISFYQFTSPWRLQLGRRSLRPN